MTYVISKQNVALAGVALGVGAGFGAAAPAATVSLAPAGFTPIAITESDTSFATFDFSGKGKRGVTLRGQTEITAPEFDQNGKPTGGKKVVKEGAINATSTASDVAFYVDPNGQLATSRNAIVPTGATVAQTAVVASGLTSNFDGTPSYGFVAYDGKPGIDISGSPLIPGFPGGPGYIQGTFSNGTFTLLDYGRIESDAVVDVPEPETWALLTMGFAGVGAAMRRGRRAQQRRASAAGC